ncbi:M14 family metallopeptidase [Desulfobacula sp.]
MKIFFKVVLIGFILVVAGVIAFTTYQFNTYKPREISQEVVPDNLKYFQETYNDCRKKFYEQAEGIRQQYKDVQIADLKIESQIDSDLTIDYIYIPAQKSHKRLLILTSAVHGVEGYVGSAIQQMVLKELIKDVSLDDLGVLVIHGINPYGFKNNRRVTENNVDLNRNSSTDNSLYSSENEGYRDLNSFLNQKEKVSLTSLGNFFFQLNAIQKIVRYSMGSLRQAVLQGQYQYEKGVYFGGKALEPSVAAVTPLIQQTAQTYDLVFNIDLHTGYGANGTLHLFPNPLKDENKKARIENIFKGYHIDWGDGDDFYTVTGDFTTYVGSTIPEKDYLTMTFEFGTLDTQTTLGSIKALHNVMIENQGVQYGYVSKKDEIEVKSRYLQGYYPSSPAWRSKALYDAREVLIQAIKKYQETAVME